MTRAGYGVLCLLFLAISLTILLFVEPQALVILNPHVGALHLPLVLSMSGGVISGSFALTGRVRLSWLWGMTAGCWLLLLIIRQAHWFNVGLLLALSLVLQAATGDDYENPRLESNKE